MQQILDSTNAELAKLQASQSQRSTSTSEVVSEEQVEKLRQDLAQAQQDAESLRASASVKASLGNLSTDDNEKPLSEQLTERVEEIRAELESRHKERVAQLEETFTTRTNGMKAQLQHKLNDGKEKYRQAISAEHEQAVEKLKSNHEQELESLKVRHRDEIDELKRHEESRFSQFRDTWVSEHPGTHDGASDVKAVPQLPRPITEISDEEAKVLVQTSNYVRGVLRTNVSKQVEAAKQLVIAQLKEEHEKDLTEKLAEAQMKANTSKEQAVSMETKKNYLKVNMADNKLKVAQAKVDVVQKAAKDTPSKPVAEIWDIVKDIKAPPAPIQPQAAKDVGTSQQTAPTNAFGQSMAFGQPNTTPKDTQLPGQLPAVASSFGKPTSFGKPSFPGKANPSVQPSAFLQSSQAQEQNGASTSPFGQSSREQNGEAQPQMVPGNIPQGPVSQQAGSASTQTNQARLRQKSPNASSSKQAQRTSDSPQQPQTKVGAPQRPAQSASNPFSQGTGPAALRGLQQSNLPIARGGSSRGGGNQRGRGQGRGGPQSIDTSRIQGQAQGRGSPQSRNSPISASLNAAAKQFVPGSKRPREESTEGQPGDSGNGKRIRGGAGGA